MDPTAIARIVHYDPWLPHLALFIETLQLSCGWPTRGLRVAWIPKCVLQTCATPSPQQSCLFGSRHCSTTTCGHRLTGSQSCSSSGWRQPGPLKKKVPELVLEVADFQECVITSRAFLNTGPLV
ncbi:uncharacterized protein LOC142777288 [Rhipicephalus microplus]|uniref:uncharacterized protein LOC142777288 n=1 Tax=Rhipicephalus microplus TaxID=6941 RepID=UPI003F6A9EDD